MCTGNSSSNPQNAQKNSLRPQTNSITERKATATTAAAFVIAYAQHGNTSFLSHTLLSDLERSN